jgi:hypothetical protein
MSFRPQHILSILVITLTTILGAEQPKLLIDETFETESLPENWKPGGRKHSFTIVDGALRGVAQPDDSHGPSISHPVTGHDLSVEFDLKFINPKGYFLFLVDGNSQFKGQAHLLRLSASGKRIQLMQDRGDPVSKIAQKKERDARGGKRIPPTEAQLADPNFYRVERLAHQAATPADGKWHHIRIELKGNSVIAQIDDNEPMATKGTVLDVPKSKIVFLVGHSGDMRIDNVKVKSIPRS